jgi:hypothetical protein
MPSAGVDPLQRAITISTNAVNGPIPATPVYTVQTVGALAAGPSKTLFLNKPYVIS